MVAYITARAYLHSGILRLLIVGAGALLFGLNSLVSGFLFSLLDGPNTAITAYNIAALVAGLLQSAVAWMFSARVALGDTKRRLVRIALAYLGVVVFSAIVTLASYADLLPSFFIQGTGSTVIRQIILGGAITAFTLAAVLLYLFYLRSHAEFHFRDAMSLALTAVGLWSVFYQSASVSWPNWAGRFCQQLGGVYLGIAVLTILREQQLKEIALEIQTADFFRDAEANYQALVETVLDGLVAVGEKGHIVLWNSAAVQTFGYSAFEALGASFAELVFPRTSPTQVYKERERLLQMGSYAPSRGTAESIATRKNVEVFPIEFTVSARPTSGGSMTTLVLRDISRRKRAEQALASANERLQHLLNSSAEKRNSKSRTRRGHERGTGDRPAHYPATWRPRVGGR